MRPLNYLIHPSRLQIWRNGVIYKNIYFKVSNDISLTSYRSHIPDALDILITNRSPQTDFVSILRRKNSNSFGCKEEKKRESKYLLKANMIKKWGQIYRLKKRIWTIDNQQDHISLLTSKYNRKKHWYPKMI